mgnify:CR=1 FL=1
MNYCWNSKESFGPFLLLCDNIATKSHKNCHWLLDFLVYPIFCDIVNLAVHSPKKGLFMHIFEWLLTISGVCPRVMFQWALSTSFHLSPVYKGWALSCRLQAVSTLWLYRKSLPWLSLFSLSVFILKRY